MTVTTSTGVADGITGVITTLVIPFPPPPNTSPIEEEVETSALAFGLRGFFGLATAIAALLGERRGVVAVIAVIGATSWYVWLSATR